jgi:hypothetical protein
MSSFDARLRDEKQRIFSRTGSSKGGSHGTGAAPESSGSSKVAVIPEDAEFEKAIQASVKETSRGNAEEDAAIEAAIRESVLAVRQQGSLPDPVPRVSEKLGRDPSIFQDESFQITDKEYQDLIEQAIRDSMTSHTDPSYAPPHTGVAELDAAPSGQQSGMRDVQDQDLKRAMTVSMDDACASNGSPEDAEFRQALEASKADAEKQQSQRTEEDIVLEYIKKQSLAEEEFRKQQQAKGKGRAEARDDDGVDDEDLKRAMEESLKMSGQDTSGPSGA